MEYLPCNVHGEYRACLICLGHFSLYVDSCFIDFSNSHIHSHLFSQSDERSMAVPIFQCPTCVYDNFRRFNDSYKYLQYTISHIRLANSGAYSVCRATRKSCDFAELVAFDSFYGLRQTNPKHGNGSKDATSISYASHDIYHLVWSIDRLRKEVHRMCRPMTANSLADRWAK